MLLAASMPATSWWNSLADYPPWLVVLGLTLVVAVVIWICAKMLKWLFWLLLIAVVCTGIGVSLWLLVR
jgi:hypothetical protein